jgi:uncharacterized membrane protein
MKRYLQKIVWLVMLVPAIYLALTWKKIPDTVAMHFDWKGNPDRYGSKTEMIVMIGVLTLVNCLVYLLLTNIYKIDPKRYAVENKERLYKIAFAVAAFISAVCCLFVYSTINGHLEFSLSLILSATGLLFAIIGNYMPNLKPNYFAGLRMPWTLENPDNWRKTHALAGKCWFAGGLLIAVVCLFLPVIPAIVVFAIVLLVITIIPCVYSYRLYKQQKITDPGKV